MVGRSKVWRLASFVDEGRSEVECSLCPVRIKYVGNTTNIARHLELRHPVEFAALDPSQAGTGRGAGPGGRHHLRHPQQNREEAAICRILAQHREELKKQAGSGGEEQHHHQPLVASPATSPCLVPAPRWSWHTPVEGEYQVPLPTPTCTLGGSCLRCGCCCCLAPRSLPLVTPPPRHLVFTPA